MTGQQIPAPPSDLPKGVGSSLNQWEKATEQEDIYRTELTKLAAMLNAVKNKAFGPAMYIIMLIMNDIQNYQGAQVTGFANVMNVETGLRNAFGTMQSDVNGQNVTNLVNTYNQVQSFLSYESSLPKNERVIDSSSISNLQNALSSIKDVFGDSWGTSEKDRLAMAEELGKWQGTNLSGSTDPNTGHYSEHLEKLQSGLQTLNQTVSALSTTTNTQLQYLTQQFKQFLGEFQAAAQSLQKNTATIVRNERSG